MTVTYAVRVTDVHDNTHVIGTVRLDGWEATATVRQPVTLTQVAQPAPDPVPTAPTPAEPAPVDDPSDKFA